jgi:hypothetical protein
MLLPYNLSLSIKLSDRYSVTIYQQLPANFIHDADFFFRIKMETFINGHLKVRSSSEKHKKGG